jgi:flagellar FliJ protein
MAFQFSLNTVLRVRGILEEQEERMLQKILFEIAQTVEAMARADEEMAGLDASRHDEVLKQIIGNQVHDAYGKMMGLKQTRKDLEERLGKLQQLRDRQLVVYKTARQNREMLTDMREVKRGEYESDVSRREQKTLDDNYIARRGRN